MATPGGERETGGKREGGGFRGPAGCRMYALRLDKLFACLNLRYRPLRSINYQLRVVLCGVSPLVWRRLLVVSTTSIAELHEILQNAFGWSGEHLHRFLIHGAAYGIPCLGGIVFREDARRVPISRFHLHCGERFRYEYDFMADWKLDILWVAKHSRGLKSTSCDSLGSAVNGHVTSCYNGEFVIESVLSILAAIRVFLRSRSHTALEVLAL